MYVPIYARYSFAILQITSKFLSPQCEEIEDGLSNGGGTIAVTGYSGVAQLSRILYIRKVTLANWRQCGDQHV